VAVSAFRNKVLFHTHVEKAAGTTIVEGLKDGLGPQHVHDLRFPHATAPQSMTPADKSRIWVLTGHFHFGAHMEKIARPKIFIASVRHPFDRFRSYVNYIGAAHPAYKYVAGKPFAQVVEEYLRDRRPAADNQMARVLTGKSMPTLKWAIENIERNYLLVAPHRRVNEALTAVLQVTTGETIAPANHNNKGPKKIAEDIGEWEDRFNAANAIDVELHRYVVENFDRWVASAPERWATICAAKFPYS
jgi:hypothetical protein